MNRKLAILRCPECGNTTEMELPIRLDDFYPCHDCEKKGNLVAFQVVDFYEVEGNG